MNSLIRRTLSSVLLGSAAATPVTALHAQQVNAQAPVAGAQASPADQEIVVTASKRDQRLQDVPAAISLLGAGTLDKLSVTSFQDYASLIPNVNQAAGAGGGSGTLVVRGLYTGYFQNTSTTAVYLGETAFTPNSSNARGALSTPDPDLVDVDHIEVLKGPQGTLYGASSLGGLVRIIPKEPDLDGRGASGSVQVSGSAASGGDLGYGLRGSLYDTVIPGTLAIGVSGFDRRDPGFITNLYTGDKHVGRIDAHGVAASIVYRPFDNLTLRGRALSQNSDTDGQIYQQNVTATGTPLYGKREKYDQIGEFFNSRYRLFELTGDYRSSLGTLTGVVSHTVNGFDEKADVTSAIGPVLSLFGTPPQGAGVSEVLNPDSSSWNEEFRFASRRFGPLEFLVGGFHTRENSYLLAAYSGVTATGAPLPAPLDNVIRLTQPQIYNELAFFGNATYYLTDKLDLTGGIRHTNIQQNGVETQSGLLATSLPAINVKNNKTLYQANLRWRPFTNLSLYARSADGYRPGGQNGVSNPAFFFYKPDVVYDYEVGAKGSLLDRKLTFDGSIYFLDWQHVQLNAVSSTGLSFTGNGGAAHVKGAELQLAYKAGGGFSAGGSAGYNDAKISSIDAATTAGLGARKGDRLPGSPKFTLSGYGDYEFPLGQDVTGDVGVTGRYQGNQVSSYPGSIPNPNYKIPAYATVDLRGSITWRTYTFKIAILNVADKNGYSGYTTLSANSPSNAYLIRPRTVQISAGMKF